MKLLSGLLMLTATGAWADCHQICSPTWIGIDSCRVVCTAVAAVRGGRSVNAAELASAPTSENPDSAAAKASRLKVTAETLQQMSDEDFARLAPGQTRTAALAKVYGTLAAFEYDAALKSAPPAATKASAQTALNERLADADAVAIDPRTLQSSGWWTDFSASLNQRERVRGPEAVAAVRGGRRIPTGTDKEMADVQTMLNQAGRSLAAGDIPAEERAALHYESGRMYDRLASVARTATPAVVKAQPQPAAPMVAAALTPKEIYQKDAPSVVLIIGAARDGMGELGTGSVIDARGRILTNAHVVIKDSTGRPYETIRIYLKPAHLSGDPKVDMHDPVKARLVRYDRELDLALLEPERSLGVPAIVLGDSESVDPGEPVVAIGHPEQGGLWTLTTGVVSTFVADLGGVKGKNVFQTDASINRGNSGGPLLDRNARQIGVNTSMARRATDGLTITAVNFSIRSNVVQRWLGADAPPTAVAMTQPERQTSETAVVEAAPAEVAASKPAAAEAAPAPVSPAPAQTPAPAAPAAAKPLPPSKPQILTPAKPYKVEDVLTKEMGEMEDLEKEMQGEIEKRRGQLGQ